MSTLTIFGQLYLGPVSQRVMINCTIDTNHSSMANHVLRNLGINHKPLWNWALISPILSELFTWFHPSWVNCLPDFTHLEWIVYLISPIPCYLFTHRGSIINLISTNHLWVIRFPHLINCIAMFSFQVKCVVETTDAAHAERLHKALKDHYSNVIWGLDYM